MGPNQKNKNNYIRGHRRESVLLTESELQDLRGKIKDLSNL